MSHPDVGGRDARAVIDKITSTVSSSSEYVTVVRWNAYSEIVWIHACALVAERRIDQRLDIVQSLPDEWGDVVVTVSPAAPDEVSR
jgi:hypothetical protein